MTHKAAEAVRAFYESGEEDTRLLSKHGAVEFIVTTAYIDKYLQVNDRVLEIGCGTGRYALHYARMGYRVDALDLVQANLDVLEKNRGDCPGITVAQGTALDLSRYENDTFDVTLLLGPMYHLFTRQDKLQALNEALRVTKRGGVMFAAYCQLDASMVQTAFTGRTLYDFLVQNKLLDEKTFLSISDPAGIFELYRKEQIDALDQELNARRLHYVGTDMFSYYRAEDIDALSDRLYQKYIAYTLSICENQNLTGASNHVLDVLQKT